VLIVGKNFTLFTLVNLANHKDIALINARSWQGGATAYLTIALYAVSLLQARASVPKSIVLGIVPRRVKLADLIKVEVILKLGNVRGVVKMLPAHLVVFTERKRFVTTDAKLNGNRNSQLARIIHVGRGAPLDNMD
jgi:hypothetical protein